MPATKDALLRMGADRSRPSDHGGRSPWERITVNLVTRAVNALNSIVAQTGVSRTDAINKALQVYEYVQDHQRRGGAIYLGEPGSNELERLHIL
jgi:hypothetical protein